MIVLQKWVTSRVLVTTNRGEADVCTTVSKCA